MADLSFLFGSSAPSSVTGGVTTTSETLPDWLQEYTRGLMGKATQVAGEEYQPYTGQRIADQTALQQQATQGVQTMQGAWQPGLQFAGQTAPSQVGTYMNPYESNVMDVLAQRGQRNLTENLLPQVNTTFTGAGQFGSTRNADFTERALRDANESIMQQQAQLAQQGYQNAIQNFQNDASRAANVANLSQQLGYQDVGMLDVTGRQQQALDQQSLDLAYQDFVNQQNYPKANLQFLNEVIRGLPTGAVQYPTNSTITAPQVMSPLQQAAAAFTGMRSTLSTPTTQQKTQ